MPPMIMVVFTSWIESRMNVESSRTTCRRDARAAGPRPASPPRAARRPPPPPCWRPDCFCTSRARAGCSSMKGGVAALLDPVHHLGHVRARMTVAAPARLTGMAAMSAAVRPAGGHAHQGLGGPAVRGARGQRPRSRGPGRRDHVGQRDVVGLELARGPPPPGSRACSRPPGSPRPRPATVSSRRLTTLSARSVAAAGDRPGAFTATETMGSAPGSMRWTIGSSISRGSSPRIAATLLRMSWEATWVETSRWKKITMFESALLGGGLHVADRPRRC